MASWRERIPFWSRGGGEGIGEEEDKEAGKVVEEGFGVGNCTGEDVGDRVGEVG